MRIHDMEHTYARLFTALPEERGPARIRRAVMARIAITRRFRTYAATGTAGAAVLGLGIAVSALVRAAAETGFGTYLSLLFTDSAIIGAHFTTFALSLLETLPIIETIATTSCVLILLTALRILAKNSSGSRVPLAAT